MRNILLIMSAGIPLGFLIDEIFLPDSVGVIVISTIWFIIASAVIFANIKTGDE